VYFKKFPKVEYETKGDGVKYTMTDITRRVRFYNKSLVDAVSYDMYDVVDGDTPESLAHKFYGDSKLHWIILISNNIMDVYTDWPMSVDRFERFVASKYDNVDAIHHYEYEQESGDTTFKIELPNDSATTIPSGATAITNYDYEEAELEKKRRIKLVRPEFVGVITQEFENIISG